LFYKNRKVNWVVSLREGGNQRCITIERRGKGGARFTVWTGGGFSKNREKGWGTGSDGERPSECRLVGGRAGPRLAGGRCRRNDQFKEEGARDVVVRK